jgi:hypothetical protein
MSEEEHYSLDLKIGENAGMLSGESATMLSELPHQLIFQFLQLPQNGLRWFRCRQYSRESLQTEVITEPIVVTHSVLQMQKIFEPQIEVISGKYTAPYWWHQAMICGQLFNELIAFSL